MLQYTLSILSYNGSIFPISTTDCLIEHKHVRKAGGIRLFGSFRRTAQAEDEDPAVPCHQRRAMSTAPIRASYNKVLRC